MYWTCNVHDGRVSADVQQLLVGIGDAVRKVLRRVLIRCDELDDGALQGIYSIEYSFQWNFQQFLVLHGKPFTVTSLRVTQYSYRLVTLF